jgi:hypothetical protein
MASITFKCKQCKIIVSEKLQSLKYDVPDLLEKIGWVMCKDDTSGGFLCTNCKEK